MAVSVVAAVNDESVLRGNLAASPLISESGVPLIVETGHASAGAAYNSGLRKTTSDIVVFAHQDVYIPRNWEHNLFRAIDVLQARNENWGVLGVYGMTGEGDGVGLVWSSGLSCEIGAPLAAPLPVVSVDELLIVLRREAGLCFDEALPNFHFYGTDIVRTALSHDAAAFVFHGPVVHNSIRRPRYDPLYWNAYKYMKHKWRTCLPLQTCTLRITRCGLPSWRYSLKRALRWFTGSEAIKPRASDPGNIARVLGYETTTTSCGQRRE